MMRKLPWRKIFVGAGIAIALLVLLALFTIWRFNTRHRSEPYALGVSFSTKYARELSLDWRENFLGLTDDLGVRQFRLMSYWDEGEPERGQYKFDDLDWQMDQAERVGATVSLAIGLRQPRYPECHAPGWANQLAEPAKVESLKQYMKVVVERYRGRAAITSWQLESEALNTAFGACGNFDRQRLVDEFKLVKTLDPKHPVIVSVSNEYGLPLGVPRGDMVGFSVYRTVYNLLGLKTYINYPFTPSFFKLRAAIIEQYLGRRVMIHELQTEPWGPKATVELSVDEQYKSMNAAKLAEAVRFAKATGIRSIDLWGAEWWYWRKTHFNDDSLWETVRDIFNQ